MSKKKGASKEEMAEAGLPNREGKDTTIALQQLPEGFGRYRIQFDFTYRGHPGVVPEGESETQPDLHLSIQQLLEDYTRGRTHPDQEKEPVFINMSVPTLNDFTDVERYREQLDAELKNVEEWIKKEKDAVKEQKEKKVEKEEKPKDNASADGKEAEAPKSQDK